MAELNTPSNLRYTAEHEWALVEGTSATVGITDYAQDSLGDIVFVQLPQVGTVVAAGQPCGEVESTKSVSDVVAPLTGTVTAVNEELDSEPELINADPYGKGWMFTMELSDSEEADGLMDARDYEVELPG